jgi:hypothetical protein
MHSAMAYAHRAAKADAYGRSGFGAKARSHQARAAYRRRSAAFGTGSQAKPIGPGTVVYTLIDPDLPSSSFNVDGSDTLRFNDGTSASFHETFTRVKRTRCASKCFVAPNKTWYQLMSDGTDVVQFRHDGVTKRTVVRKPHPNALSDDEIREVLGVQVHTSSDRDNPEYRAWQGRVLDALQSGRATVDDMRRVWSDSSGDGKYIGGRWLYSHLKTFVGEFPEYDELIVPI